MFSTLVESRAIRRRGTRGIVTSVLLHTLLIAAAVALTRPTRVEARPDNPVPPVVYTTVPRRHELPPAPATPRPATQPRVPNPISIPVPTIVPTSLPPVDISGPSIEPERIVIGGGITPVSNGSRSTETSGPDAILDIGLVDRAPRLIGNAPAPRYPDMLRQSGATGQVVVRFVVDTLGRAEMGDLIVVDATHPLFARAVKSALTAYRFTPGEVDGRKVRTMVQLPFTFTLR